MKLYTIFLTFCFCFWGVCELKAQDPIYSQFYNSPLELNPAFAGNSYAPIFSVNYRNQWPAISSVYQTYSASYDQYISKYNSGIGIILFSDNQGAGALKTFRISAVYAYQLKINEELRLKIGLEASAINSRLDWSKLSFPDQIDAEFGGVSPGGTPFPSQEIQPDGLGRTYLDLSTGLLLYNPLFYVGVALKHVNTPDDSFIDGGSNFAGLPFRLSLHGGVQINLDEGNKKDQGAFITPNVLFVKQADFAQLNVGAYTGINRFFLGGWYRHAWGNPDALIFSAGVRTGVFKIGYSFDYTVSELSVNTGGSHEIGFLINLESVVRKPSELNDCLRLFR